MDFFSILRLTISFLLLFIPLIWPVTIDKEDLWSGELSPEQPVNQLHN